MVSTLSAHSFGGCVEESWSFPGEREESIVKAIYADLDMEDRFRHFERQSFKRIESTIDGINELYGLNTTIFERLVDQLRNREV